MILRWSPFFVIFLLPIGLFLNGDMAIFYDFDTNVARLKFLVAGCQLTCVPVAVGSLAHEDMM